MWRPGVAFIGGERHGGERMVRGGPGGHAMPRVARVRAGAASCGAREARARCLRVGGGVAHVGVVGDGLGGRCSGRGGRF